MKKVVLTLVGDQVLIFELNDIKRIRELGILGTLIGTLPKFPQQNIFLSKPLLLSFYECLWLIEKGHGILVDSKSYNEELKIREIEEGVVSSPIINNRVVIKDTYSLPSEEKYLMEICKRNQVSIKEYSLRNFQSISKLREHLRAYEAFKALKDMEYYISPGLKFGGEFVCYPGDPLRYHSHLIVNTKSSFYTNDLIVGGRLATGVKKLWVLIDCTSEGYDLEAQDLAIQNSSSPSRSASFSIEWAGFG